MSGLNRAAIRPLEFESRETDRWRIAGNLHKAVERRPWASFAIFSALFFAIVFCLSAAKLLWLDELITLHIARLGSFTAIWQALERGADPNPPLTSLLVQASTHIFGNHEFAYRMPAAIGYWVGILSLFVYLRRLLPASWALAGTVLSTTMAAFDYSYESRSYGIFYGLAMLALLCWSVTTDPATTRTRRRLSLVGMTVALAAGVFTNYFAVLAFLPLAAGEITRTVRRLRKVVPLRGGGFRLRRLVEALDLRIWDAFLLAILPLLVCMPLVQHAIARFSPYAWNKVSLGQVFDSYTEMVDYILYPILALFGFALWMRLVGARTRRICAACRARIMPRWMADLAERTLAPLPIPWHEGVAVFFLMAYPFLGYIVASVHGGMLSPRFVIPVCFGFAIAATLVAHQLFRRFRLAPSLFLVIALAWLICRESVVGYWYEEQKQCFYKVVDDLPQAEAFVPQGSPIVIPDPLLALTFRHYAPPPDAARVVFPVDFPAIRFFRGDDSPDENLWAGRDFAYKLPIVPLAQFQNHAGKYLIIAGDGNWLLSDLAVHHYPFQQIDINTRAAAIGGFTPLARATPVFYVAYGGGTPGSAMARLNQPLPFQQKTNLPQARKFTVPKADP